VVAFASSQDRSAILGAAEDHVELSVGLLREHALNVFATQELVHEQIGARIAGVDWEAISRSREVASFLRETRDRISQISSIWLADPTSHVPASSSLPYPRGLTFENSEEFRAHHAGDRGMHIGEQHLAVESMAAGGRLIGGLQRR
jgi:hypothetical protein